MQHLKKEYKTYILKEKDIDAEKAILGNPLLATFVPQLFQYMEMYTDDDNTRIHKEFVNDMVRNFVNKASHLSITFENSTEEAATALCSHCICIAHVTSSHLHHDVIAIMHES